MGGQELKVRTKKMALRVVKLTEALPRSLAGRTFGGQLIRSGTSVAANYRAAQFARSKREFIAKLGIAIEECDETVFWLEMVDEAGLLRSSRITTLKQEALELLAILISIKKRSQARA